jgi:hypothetical protein
MTFAAPVFILFFMILLAGVSVIALQKVFHVRGDREERRHPKAAQEVYVHPRVRDLKRPDRH